MQPDSSPFRHETSRALLSLLLFAALALAATPARAATGCPSAGTTVTRSNGAVVRYDGPAANNPDLCLITVLKDVPNASVRMQGQQFQNYFQIWWIRTQNSADAYAAMKTVVNGPIGTTASFVDTRSGGSQGGGGFQWRREFRKDPGEDIKVGNTVYHTWKLVQHVTGVIGNRYEAIYSFWFDQSGGIILRRSYQSIAGAPETNPAEVEWIAVSIAPTQ